MSVEFFDGQRREMIAAIRVIAGHLADDLNSRHFAGLRSLTSWLLHFASAFSRWLRAMS